MSQLIVQQNTCLKCNESLIESDNFCRICGLARNQSVATDSSSEIQFLNCDLRKTERQLPATLEIVLNNRLLVVVLIAVIGPLGLPALWFSPRFSRRAKIITTVIYFLVTAVLPIFVTWYCLDILMQPLVDAMQNR